MNSLYSSHNFKLSNNNDKINHINPKNLDNTLNEILSKNIKNRINKQNNKINNNICHIIIK